MMRTQNKIQEFFGQMANKTDFISLLNMVREEILDPEVKPFSDKEIGFYSMYMATSKQENEKTQLFNTLEKLGVKKISLTYKTFEIKKKSGDSRKIHAPKKRLKLIQKCLNHILREIHKPHAAAKGFVPTLSIVDNARAHTQMNYVLNVDIKDFFPSVEQARVRARLLAKPFELGSTPERTKIASIIAILCCTKMEVERHDANMDQWYKSEEYVLPQGAPTSPTMTNIICERLDILLTGLAKRFHCKYTRYADDITFSCMTPVFKKGGDFMIELNRIIQDQGFHLKTSKTRMQSMYYRQEVTGLIVNDKVNVNKRYVRQLRKWLYYWETYGYEKASQIFLTQYLKDKGHVKSGTPNLDNVICGKLQYLKMVKGKGDGAYLGLFKRYEELVGKMIEGIVPSSDEEIIEKILDIWETQGIDIAEEKLNQLTSWMKED